MTMIRAILIASLSVPVLIFVLFLGVGLALLGVDLFAGGKYSNGWFGMVYAAVVYTYFATVISTIPTIVLGLPMSLLAQKFGLLNSKAVLIGAVITGGVFLGIAAAIFFQSGDIQLLLRAMLAGGLGGLLNGYVFLRCVRPNKSLPPTGYRGT